MPYSNLESAIYEESCSLRVRGIVQGVGFRPHVWRLAQQYHLAGNVLNDGDGVLINVRGACDAIDAFIDALQIEKPPLAVIDTIERLQSEPHIADDAFNISESRVTQVQTGVAADAATCPDCLQELHTATDKRHGYAFTNCTHCGPRFSIVRAIPYDRKNTSMSAFELCETCGYEYENPADRRFHAQPNACPECGPSVWLCDEAGGVMAERDAIEMAAQLIQDGAILAIKGIGGFHLACDATNPRAVAKLRTRKQRPDKPLALMARDIDQISHYCHVNDEEAELLSSNAAPIVVLQARKDHLLPDAIAPGHTEWGFALHYSPLHHLLMEALDSPIVLTSGNRSSEPQCTENDDALQRLNGIADAFVMHNRGIENRIDDSVVRKAETGMQMLRRARGYAPGQIRLPDGFSKHPPMLALGAELKNTFCLFSRGHAVLSQHMGDLEDARTFADYQHNIALYNKLFDHQPTHVVIDQHPEYLSSKLGRDWCDTTGTELIEIQHHHAHIASCMLDNGLDIDSAPVIGIALDGLGLGDDGKLWGGEILLADYHGYQRLAHLKPVAMPGGALAVREPWRNLFAYIEDTVGWQDFCKQYPGLPATAALGRQPVKTIQAMLQRGVNCPQASSTGRLFDAVAAALNVAPIQCSFEGQAAMAVERLAAKAASSTASGYKFAVEEHEGQRRIDTSPMWQALFQDLDNGVEHAEIAVRFHRGLADILVEVAVQQAREHGIRTAALSGGVFQNRVLLTLIAHQLTEHGLQVLTHRQVPANDGGLSLGQAAIATARIMQGR